MDIEEVARCAWNEILQTAPRSTSLFALFENLLEPGDDLTWRDGGLGRGTEMRRSFSALFGRFFARAYLELHHGFSWFAAIDGDQFQLSPTWRIRRKRRSRAEMPDWVCARPGELAIGEAKGSHQKGNATRGGMPGPIKTANGQIHGVLVEKRTAGVWKSKRVKGWAVMSRWGVASPPRDPYLYVLDPETDGDALKPAEMEELEQAVARIHVEQTAFGLGLLGDDRSEMIGGRLHRVRIADDPENRFFGGIIMSPFGPLDLELDEAKDIARFLPHSIRFVGLDLKLFHAYQQGSMITPRPRVRIGDNAIASPDGLVVSQLEQISDVQRFTG